MSAPSTVPPSQTPPPAPHITHYTVVDLPPLPGGGASQAQGINAAGDVVGYSVSNFEASAVLWKNGVPEDLHILNSWANGVNASDQIAGYFTSADGNPHAMLVSDQAAMQDLGTLPGFDSSVATGINDAGVVVGVSFSYQNTADQQGFVWTSTSGMQPIPGALSAEGINRSGQVAGIDSGLHAALFSGGQVTDLGTIDTFSAATAVNSAGHVAGFSGTHALFFDGTLRDLGLRDDWTSAVATGINDTNVVVGSGQVGSVSHPFTWTSGAGLTDVNTLIPAGSGWTLFVNTGINAHGQICGLGQVSGALHAFVLNPN